MKRPIKIAKGRRSSSPFSSIEEAVESIRAGKMVIVVDDANRENEGDLTIADLGGERFDVQIVPYTMQHTNLARAQVRDRVNLECDMVGKYVARAIERGSPPNPQPLSPTQAEGKGSKMRITSWIVSAFIAINPDAGTSIIFTLISLCWQRRLCCWLLK